MTEMPTSASLLHATLPWLTDHPDLQAMSMGNTVITYAETGARAAALARLLRALGIAPGDRVATMLTPRPESVIAYLACWLAGAVPVGLNTRFRREEQRHILTDSASRLLLSVVRDGGNDLTSDLDSHHAELGLPVLRLGPGWAQGDLPAPLTRAEALADWRKAVDAFDPSVAAVIVYTSGSTGRPKGAMITHAGLAFRAHTLHTDRFHIPHVRQILDLPVNHIGALASGIAVSLVAGGHMLMHENFDPAFTLKCLTQDRIDVLNGVPAMLARLVDHPDFAKSDLSRLRFVSWGAGPVNARILDALMQAAPRALFSQQYGMTESNGPIVFTPPTRDREILLDTTGRPDPRLSLRIADRRDRPVAPGQDGEVQVLHPHPFAGYLDNPEATAACHTADGWLRTGDLARLRDDGYLVFCGRSKEMFKSGGFNVYPREIELALEDLPQVRAAAVIGIDDETWGQVGHAFVELATPADPADLLVALHGRLANYKVPKALSVLDAIPRIGVSKIDRIALARRLTQG